MCQCLRMRKVHHCLSAWRFLPHMLQQVCHHVQGGCCWEFQKKAETAGGSLADHHEHEWAMMDRRQVPTSSVVVLIA